ncbi:hypothetical protein [Agrococcus sp. Marseille-Q4369]|uniref:hypothetical protein n=1 Tax=Agrococcus sp. Marseille-Q4369 TaxID=2810513 RepID=UPI001B8B3E9F|nr:hypothetical protein [Agrococcus sp. Marseille-Q4369]QUW18274.1 hypothetical protein JSQ78_10625 [Agrococcus sp. Marseille-Q4369]
MSDPTASAPQSTIGRARFGGGTSALVLVSLLIGLAISSGLGGLYAWIGETGEAWVRFAIVAVVTLPVSAMLPWALLVDRSSLKGSIERPEDSIESRWYAKAAEGTMHDVLITVGIGAALFSFTQLQVNTGILLIVLGTMVMADFGVRYQLAKRADA